jgi:hypothetical protein
MEDTTVEEQQHPTPQDWNEISRQLREPFDPSDVDFRVQGKANEQTSRAQVVAYIDARAVQDRLDAVVGAGNWAFDWQPLVIEKSDIMVAKGTLTIHGVSKSDVGSASTFEQSLGAVSHCFKRAAVHWGIGRYLYNLPMNWVSVERGGRIPDSVLRELRSRLPRPDRAPAGQRSVEMEGGERVAETPAERRAQLRSARPDSASAASAPASASPTAQARELPVTPLSSSDGGEPMATEKQIASIRKLCEALGKPEPESAITYGRARELITQLSGEYQRSRRAS